MIPRRRRDALRTWLGEVAVSSHPKVAAIAAALTAQPGDRRTLAGWASHVAVSERSLERLMVAETGLTFGRWRRQPHLVITLLELVGKGLGPEGVERPRLRSPNRIHRDVQESARDDAYALLRGLTGWAAT